MPSFLCLTVRFLQPYSHGRDIRGDPEWPPSPLRVYQALVAAAAARWNERMRLEYAVPALQWLERQKPPMIVAAMGFPSGVKYRLYVPDNVADKVAKSWSGGREGSIADYRTEKDVRPTHLKGEAVHYLFPLNDGGCPDFPVLCAAAQSITHLGWGVDMVAGHALLILPEEAAKLTDGGGQCWRPVEGSSATGYRVPIVGTLDALIKKHHAFLNRLGPDGFTPVPPLTEFSVVGYRKDTDSAPHPYAAFSILKPDASGFRPFDSVRRTHIVAGMVRHMTAAAAARAGWPDDRINAMIHGHTPNGRDKARSEEGAPRFSYLPLPSIEWRGSKGLSVGSIRRVLVVGPPVGGAAEVAWIRRTLNGHELIDEETKQPTSIVTLLPNSDRGVLPYVRPSSVWTTVTPVVLPGHSDGAAAKTERLLRKALTQAGLPSGLADRACLDWRQVGFLPGLDLARRYAVPAHLAPYPRYHVRIEWPAEMKIPGPLAIGGGRFGGLGLFAAVDHH